MRLSLNLSTSTSASLPSPPLPPLYHECAYLINSSHLQFIRLSNITTRRNPAQILAVLFHVISTSSPRLLPHYHQQLPTTFTLYTSKAPTAKKPPNLPYTPLRLNNPPAWPTIRSKSTSNSSTTVSLLLSHNGSRTNAQETRSSMAQPQSSPVSASLRRRNYSTKSPLSRYVATYRHLRYIISFLISSQFWLLGYEFPSTLFVITPDMMYILTTKKKGRKRRQLSL